MSAQVRPRIPASRPRNYVEPRSVRRDGTFSMLLARVSASRWRRLPLRCRRLTMLGLRVRDPVGTGESCSAHQKGRPHKSTLVAGSGRPTKS